MIIIQYITLMKPGIILGNMLSIIGGALVASQGKINYDLILHTLIGTSLIIASNCIINNIIEYPLDLLMARTKNRALILESVTPKCALIYAIILMLSGFIILFYKTNLQVIYLSAISSIIYIGIYSALIKKKSIYNTLIGSLSGASPPAIGYCSVTNRFDVGALILMILFVMWQIPHFYSIAVFRQSDYKSANIPTFPSEKGNKKTKQHMICYIIGFMISILILTFNNHLSYICLLFMESLTGYWLYIACTGNYKNIPNDKVVLLWAKKMFILSIIIMMSFNITISIDSLYRCITYSS